MIHPRSRPEPRCAHAGGRLAVDWVRTARTMALWRRSDEVERIACHQRHRRCVGRVEHRDILGLDDPRALHAIAIDTAQRLDLEEVANADVLERAEEAVAMPCDPRVPLGARPRGVVDMADAAVQGPVVGALSAEVLRLKAEGAASRSTQ